MSELFNMDASFFEQNKEQLASKKPEGGNDYRKNALKLDPSQLIFVKPIHVLPADGVNRTSPVIQTWMHRIPVGETTDGKTKFEFVCCPRTEMGVNGSGKVCRFCGHNSKLWNDEQAGDTVAKAMRGELKARFYGYVPVLVVRVKDAKTNQDITGHPDLNQVRILHLSKKNWDEQLLPKLEGDEMTAVGYPKIFGNPGRLLAITAEKTTYGIQSKINVTDKSWTVQLPPDFVDQLIALDFDANFKKSNRTEIEAAFQKYVVEGNIKIPAEAIAGAATASAPVQQKTGGLSAALNTNLAPAPAAAPALAAEPADDMFDMNISAVEVPAPSAPQVAQAAQGAAAPMPAGTDTESLKARMAARRQRSGTAQ